jgi:rRNA maturation protein Nop10
MMLLKRNDCPNLNHGRSNPPVRFCPKCGEVVNVARVLQRCAADKHSKERLNQNRHCVDCGEQLIK